MNSELYKRSKSGKIQLWRIVVEGNKFCTHEGFVDGKITQSEWTICEPKNVGNAKQTTPEQQALKEAEAKYKKQKEKGYTEDIEAVDTAAKKIDPMLAHKWGDYKDSMGGYGLFSQPKLDGIRCIFTADGLFTRNGKPITAVPHIQKEIESLFLALTINNPSTVINAIDGELYNHDLKNDFNQITSIVRKSKHTEQDLEKSKALIQYHIYDIDCNNKNFTDRNHSLSKAFEKGSFQYLKYVETTFIGNVLVGPQRLSELDYLYGSYLERGYEGQMIRVGESTYSKGRTPNLLKRKEFMDEEFEIVDIEEGVGNRSGMMGRIKFKMKNGKLFDSNARGSYEYFRKLLIEKDQYIGKMATVRFQNYTPDGSVRFPVMIDIDRDDL